NISMDQCLVDITDSESIEIGEQVTLLGNSGNMSIRPEEWASKSYRIAYEVLCGFGNRLPRVYT
ncbi:MAG: alanine racemase C-terminal domain-containing protein, partial [Candidatus Sericytochromatia bacterium]